MQKDAAADKKTDVQPANILDHTVSSTYLLPPVFLLGEKLIPGRAQLRAAGRASSPSATPRSKRNKRVETRAQ